MGSIGMLVLCCVSIQKQGLIKDKLSEYAVDNVIDSDTILWISLLQ